MKLSAKSDRRPWQARACGVLIAATVSAAPAWAQCGWTDHPLTAPQATLFGASVAIEDNIALVGAPLDATIGLGAGCAHIYDARIGWNEMATLLPSDGHRARRFGQAVAVTADLAFVGAPGVDGVAGAVYVFDRNAGARNGWGEVARLDPLGFPSTALFGASLAVWQDLLVVGAPGFGEDSGRAYVWRRGRDNTQWRLVEVLGPADRSPSRFGQSVAINADWIAVGAPQGKAGPRLVTGAAYLFERRLENWTMVERFTPPELSAHQRFGAAVALGPSTLAVGAPFDGDLAVDSGAAYVFERSSDGAWPLQRKLYALDASAGALFGEALAMTGEELLVGARFAGVSQAGQAYVFERGRAIPGRWMECECIQLADSFRGAIQGFGAAVAVAPGRRLIGAPTNCAIAVPGVAGASLAHLYASTARIQSYCEPADGSPHCRGVLSSLGCPSASLASEFHVRAYGMDGARLGMLFYSVGERSDVPWGSAVTALCLQPPLQRCGLTRSDGSPGRCDGQLDLDWNAFAASHPTALGQPFFAGQTLRLQAIGRDPATSKHSALSNALEFAFAP